jgi:hypothetical protein
MHRLLVSAFVAAAGLGVASGALATDQGSMLRMFDASGAVKTEITLTDVARNSVRAAADPNVPGHYVLYFRLTSGGVAKFDRLTKLLAQRGARLKSFQHIIFEVNGHIYARPFIDYLQFPRGLDGRSGIEINQLTQRTATRLAAEIRHG